jgi:hypothetical protein
VAYPRRTPDRSCRPEARRRTSAAPGNPLAYRAPEAGPLLGRGATNRWQGHCVKCFDAA